MTPEEYIKKLEALKKKGERAVISELPSIEKQALEILREFIDENLDTKDGEFVVNDRAIKAINLFTDVFLKAVGELKDYKGMVGQYLKNFKDVGTLMQEFQKSNGLNVKQARLGAVQEIVTAEILNRYSENGLNPGFVQPLRELLFNNITGGLNKKQAMEQLKDFILGGKDQTGKLGRYLEQTAQQGVDSYTGAVNVRIMQTFTIDTYIMSGSLIKTSSPQCRYVVKELGGIIEREDWPNIKAIAKDNGLIPGTTFENLPLHKNHWGCRHEFTPVVLTETQKEKLLANPVNN
jgi:hypothetical protein